MSIFFFPQLPTPWLCLRMCSVGLRLLVLTCVCYSTRPLSLMFQSELFGSICSLPTAVKAACPLTFCQNYNDMLFQSTESYRVSLWKRGDSALNIRYWNRKPPVMSGGRGHKIFSVIRELIWCKGIKIQSHVKLVMQVVVHISDLKVKYILLSYQRGYKTIYRP